MSEIFQFISRYCLLIFAAFSYCYISPCLATEDDDLEPMIDSILQARNQLVNFKAKVEFKLLVGELRGMPNHYQFDYWSDDIRQRIWFQQMPLTPIQKVETSNGQFWARKSMMGRDGLWFFTDRPTMLDVRHSSTDAMKTKGFSVYGLGLQLYPNSVWKLDDLDSYGGILGLKLNGRYELGEAVTFNGASIQKVHWTDIQGKTRILWVEVDALRIHRIEILSPLTHEESRQEDVATTTITSAYFPENATVIPNNVVVEYIANGQLVTKYSLQVNELSLDFEFTDEDFDFEKLGLRINATVIDHDARKFWGYWNGRDWSNKSPITHAPITDIIQKENTRLDQPQVGRWPVSIIVVAVVSLLFVAGLLVNARRSSRV